MKLLVLCSAMFVAANAMSKELTQEILEDVTMVGMQCAEEMNASEDDLAQLVAHQIPESHEGQCVISCFYKHYEIQSEDGSFTIDTIPSIFQKVKDDDADLYETVKEIGEICLKSITMDSDHCVSAKNMAVCSKDEIQSRGVNIEFLNA